MSWSFVRLGFYIGPLEIIERFSSLSTPGRYQALVFFSYDLISRLFTQPECILIKLLTAAGGKSILSWLWHKDVRFKSVSRLDTRLRGYSILMNIFIIL